MQFFRKVQGVILTQKHLSSPGNFVHFSKNIFYFPKNEISRIYILHFFRFLHIMGPIYFAISRKDDGYDPLFLHDN